MNLKNLYRNNRTAKAVLFLKENTVFHLLMRIKEICLELFYDK